MELDTGKVDILVLKINLIIFADGSDVGSERKRSIKDNSEILLSHMKHEVSIYYDSKIVRKVT